MMTTPPAPDPDVQPDIIPGTSRPIPVDPDTEPEPQPGVEPGLSGGPGSEGRG